MEAKPKASSTCGVTTMLRTACTVPRMTGVVSICTRARPRLATNRVTDLVPSPADDCTCSCNGRARSASASCSSAAAIKAASSAKSWTGSQARSMSTDNRGRSCSNRLIAVPPFSAKRGSRVSTGRISTSNCTRSV
ncbi:hypothetical protein D3C72_1460740 [compost metagenome]